MAREDRPGMAEARKTDEEVLVVPRSDLEAVGVLRQGFSPGSCERFLEVVKASGGFVPRRSAETDPSLKQVIPYAVVVHEEMVFLLERRSGGGEARLHRKLSIGVGGHINPVDVSGEKIVESGLLRELSEELEFAVGFDYRPIGLINDDDSPVGQVHIGIVYRVTVQGAAVRVRETDALEGGFVPVQSLASMLPRMESWSKLITESLFLR